jgi:hypothetical protein
MFNALDATIGKYSIGMGAKFLIASIDVAAIMPADIALNPPVQGNISEERLASPFARIIVNASVSF